MWLYGLTRGQADTTPLKGNVAKGRKSLHRSHPCKGFLGCRTFHAETVKVQGKPGQLAALQLALVIPSLGKWLQ